MIWLDFGKQTSKQGPLFLSERIFWNGVKWTPFVRLFWRYCRDPRESRCGTLRQVVQSMRPPYSESNGEDARASLTAARIWEVMSDHLTPRERQYLMEQVRVTHADWEENHPT
jgi:hypothetical protein